jgi:hypothetical protein
MAARGGPTPLAAVGAWRDREAPRLKPDPVWLLGAKRMADAANRERSQEIQPDEQLSRLNPRISTFRVQLRVDS